VATPNRFRLGFFTRLTDEVPPGDVYRRALETFETAEALGFDAGWVAQHHAHNEGGLPAPLVFLAAAAARTRRIRLITGIVTIPLENAVRLAEDAAVVNHISGGRLELGLGTGGNAVTFSIFDRDLENRHVDYDRVFNALRDALAGRPLVPNGPTLYPPAPELLPTIWEATFRVEGGIRAAEHGTGLLLARTAMRPEPAPGEAVGARQLLGDAQFPIVDAYLKRWTWPDVKPRVGLSRAVYIAPTRAEAFEQAERGMQRHANVVARREGFRAGMTVPELLAWADVHIGTPDDVIASLRADRLIPLATDLTVQVHPVDPTHEQTLRSLRFMATEVAPALGWSPGASDG
jgi:putative FMN-dependent luciferase-like monooxygenase